MKKFLLATVALVALGATVPALAADLAARPYTKAPAYAPQPIYNWTGFYIGGPLGRAFGAGQNFVGARERLPRRVAGGAALHISPAQSVGCHDQQCSPRPHSQP